MNHVSNVFGDIPLMLNAIMDYIDEIGLTEINANLNSTSKK